jgi:hypothetical protein
MFWLVSIVRVLVGLPFFLGSVVFFLNVMEPPPPPPEGSPAAMYMGAMIPTGYMHAVKVVEVIGGLLLLLGRYPLIGLTLVTPVAVNILFFEIFILHAPGPGMILVPLCFFLVWGYRSHFAPVFALKPKIG